MWWICILSVVMSRINLVRVMRFGVISNSLRLNVIMVV